MPTSLADTIDEARPIFGAHEIPDEILPLVGATSAPQPFPTEFLGTRLEAACRAIMAKAFVPASTAAQSLLSACSLALQAHFNVVLPTGQCRPISLYFVTIAKSGARKSTSDDMAMAEAAAFQQELHEAKVANEPAAAAAKAAWTIAKTDTIKAYKGRGQDALREALKELGPEPSPIPDSTVTTRVGTTQGLIRAFELGRPTLGLMSDEGGSWLGGYSMTDEQRLMTIATLSDLWDGKPIQKLTGGEGAVMLYGRRLTFHLMIQPILSGKLLGDAEMKGQGFLSRLLVTQPESLAGIRIVDPDAAPNPVHEQALADYHQRYGQIIRAALPIDLEKNRLSPRALGLTTEAQRMWWTFYNENERRVGPGGDLEEVEGFVGKLPELAARLAANLAAFEQGTQLSVINAESLARGIALAEYYLDEALRLFGIAPVDAILAHANNLSIWLSTKYDEPLICAAVIRQFGPSQFKKISSDQLGVVIGALIRHNHLSPPVPGGGIVKGAKRKIAWRVMVRNV